MSSLCTISMKGETNYTNKKQIGLTFFFNYKCNFFELKRRFTFPQKYFSLEKCLKIKRRFSQNVFPWAYLSTQLRERNSED